MAENRIKAIAVATLGFLAATTGAVGEPAAHRYHFLSTRITYKFVATTPSGDEYGIDGVAFVASVDDGTIYRCAGRILLRQTDPKKTAAESLDITGEPLDCHAMVYEKPQPDPLDGDLIFSPGPSQAEDLRTYLSFFRLSQTFATIAFCTTVDETRVRCTPAVALRRGSPGR